MNPELTAALTTLQPPVFSGPPNAAELRAYFDKAGFGTFKAHQQQYLPPDNAYTVDDRRIPVDGGEIFARCVVPVVKDTSEKFPVLVYIRGGGWTLGSVDIDDYYLRILAVDLKISVVNVEYRLAPEYPFPTAVDDCLAALKWTVSSAPPLRADLRKGFIVGGHSAGGNLSAVLAHITRDDPFFADTPLTGQLLREPFVVHTHAYPEQLKSEMRAMEENKEVPPLTAALMNQFTVFYGAPPSDPRFSPLLFPSHCGLPRAVIHAAEFDVLRDDALVYNKVLRAAGVETRLVLFPGVSHGFHHDFPASKAAAEIRENVVQGLQWLLNRV